MFLEDMRFDQRLTPLPGFRVTVEDLPEEDGLGGVAVRPEDTVRLEDEDRFTDEDVREADDGFERTLVCGRVGVTVER